MSKPALLELDGVSKLFGGLAVITQLSFCVAAGERLALIGPNGAGKSTVFNLISGVYPTSAGRILIEGRDVTHMASRQRIYQGVSRSFQNIRLMEHQSAIDNIMLGQHPTASSLADLLTPYRLQRKNPWVEQAKEALERAKLIHYADRPVNTLPYGVRKRIDLLRAVMARPKLLLLDEPAAGLNPVETEELHEQLMTIHQSGISLLVVEHDMHFVDRLCTRVVVINFGEKIAEGTMEQVRGDAKVREAYLGADVATEASDAS